MKNKTTVIQGLLVASVTMFLLSFRDGKFGGGTIYCKANCENKIKYMICPDGNTADPCKNGKGGEYSKTMDDACFEIAPGYHYCPTK